MTLAILFHDSRKRPVLGLRIYRLRISQAVALLFLATLVILLVKSARLASMTSLKRCFPLMSHVEADSRHVSTIEVPIPGRLANQMWRIASLYGIGRATGRQPFLNALHSKQMRSVSLLAKTFPRLFCKLQVLRPRKEQSVRKRMGASCCKFYKFDIRVGAPVVELENFYLQSYKYFHDFKYEVMEMFQFPRHTVQEADRIAETISRNISMTHTLCVHTRRTDFVGFVMRATSEEFTLPSVEYLTREIKRTANSSVTIILFGDDPHFVARLNFTSLNASSHIMRDSRPEVDLAFARRHCDTILLTASGSTFGWWMAYMSSTSSIYYNAQLTREPGRMFSFVNDFDFFPPEWSKIVVENGVARTEHRWWHEWHKNG